MLTPDTQGNVCIMQAGNFILPLSGLIKPYIPVISGYSFRQFVINFTSQTNGAEVRFASLALIDSFANLL